MSTYEIVMTFLIYVLICGLLLKGLIMLFNRISASAIPETDETPQVQRSTRKPLAKELKTMRRHSRYRYSEDSRLSMD